MNGRGRQAAGQSGLSCMQQAIYISKAAGCGCGGIVGVLVNGHGFGFDCNTFVHRDSSLGLALYALIGPGPP